MVEEYLPIFMICMIFICLAWIIYEVVTGIMDAEKELYKQWQENDREDT